MAKTKVEYWFDPFEGLELKGKDKSNALQEAADLLLESILSDVADSKSPVSGDDFPELNEEYADREHSGDKISRLELSGDLLGSLVVKPYKGGILVTVPNKQQGKADGHNNFSGKSKLPLRQFIPKADESFRKDITDEIQAIAEDFMEE